MRIRNATNVRTSSVGDDNASARMTLIEPFLAFFMIRSWDLATKKFFSKLISLPSCCM